MTYRDRVRVVVTLLVVGLGGACGKKKESPSPLEGWLTKPLEAQSGEYEGVGNFTIEIPPDMMPVGAVKSGWKSFDGDVPKLRGTVTVRLKFKSDPPASSVDDWTKQLATQLEGATIVSQETTPHWLASLRNTSGWIVVNAVAFSTPKRGLHCEAAYVPSLQPPSDDDLVRLTQRLEQVCRSLRFPA